MPSTEPCEITFCGQRLLLDAEGAIYWPEQSLLLVSDLHFEKASFLAQFGAMLPRYDTHHTLQLITQLIARYQPARIVCLGDSFHDAKAHARLQPADRESLAALVPSVGQWNWVLGNHDASLSTELPGAQTQSLDIAGIRLLHEPEQGSTRKSSAISTPNSA